MGQGSDPDDDDDRRPDDDPTWDGVRVPDEDDDEVQSPG